MKRINKKETVTQLFVRMLLHPIFIIVYGIAWFILVRLCRYGNLNKYAPLLTVCVAFFLFWLILFFVRIKKRDSNAQSKSRITNTRIYKAVSTATLICITLGFGIHIISSAVNLNGHLAWWLKDLKDKRSITLIHNNIYESGIGGILEDIADIVALPDDLYISSQFDLDFSADGTILSFDTYLYGKNEEGETESFLISYNREVSKKMTVYLHGVVDDDYSDTMSLSPLLDTLERVDLIGQIESWSAYGYETYGILYIGIRDWGYQTDGITYIDPAGNTLLAEQTVTYSAIINYTTSVYITEVSDGTILDSNGTIRYIPVESLDKAEESNIQAAKLFSASQNSISNGATEDENKAGTLITDSNGSLEYYVTDALAYRLEVEDAALGTRYYSLKKANKGENWILKNADPFSGEGGSAYGLVFLTEDLGFAGLSHSGGSYGELYRTEDGGETFTKVELPSVEVKMTSGLLSDPFDYPYMPYYDGDQLMLEVGQGEDGDYNSGCNGLFSLDDDGITWLYLREKSIQ